MSGAGSTYPPAAHRFRKDQSGNPGGRPRVMGHIQELARVHAAEAIKTLFEIRLTKKASPSSRALATIALLDRAYGRPKQDLDLNHRRLEELTDKRIYQRLEEPRAERARVAAEVSRLARGGALPAAADGSTAPGSEETSIRLPR